MKQAVRDVRRRSLPIALIALAALALWIAAVASQIVPGLGFVEKVRPFAYDISVGYLVSYIFYLLVVVIPEVSTRRRTARLLSAHYRSFKLACIEIYLGAIGDSWDSELPEQLLCASTFAEYFSGRYSDSQTRWHAVHNGLYECGVPELVLECELFAREIEYTLIKLNIEDSDVATFLKRLSRSLLRLRTSTPTYDDVKRLLNFLYPLHSHWSILDGYVGRDPVADMIARL